MSIRGRYCGPGRNRPFCTTRPRPLRSSARWSRAVILSSRSRRAAMAAAAALALGWPGMATARAEAPANLSRTSTSGSYLAARHANGERDAAAAASYYRAALRGDPRNKVIYYYRGICYERAKQWPKAEADLKKSLELYPEQPHVLNHLGYSWIDQGVHLDEGMSMIKRAVDQRADDGYIVDSLGWAHYRLGHMDEAVKQDRKS